MLIVLILFCSQLITHVIYKYIYSKHCKEKDCHLEERKCIYYIYIYTVYGDGMYVCIMYVLCMPVRIMYVHTYTNIYTYIDAKSV